MVKKPQKHGREQTGSLLAVKNILSLHKNAIKRIVSMMDHDKSLHLSNG